MTERHSTTVVGLSAAVSFLFGLLAGAIAAFNMLIVTQEAEPTSPDEETAGER